MECAQSRLKWTYIAKVTRLKIVFSWMNRWASVKLPSGESFDNTSATTKSFALQGREFVHVSMLVSYRGMVGTCNHKNKIIVSLSIFVSMQEPLGAEQPSVNYF